MLTPPSPDLRLFWTAYDPLELASDSIDVLGFLPGYIALANKLLPGLTTVTTCPRYVSMLCAAVSAAEREFPSSGSVDIRQSRLSALKSYERAWALACGLAAEDDAIGQAAVDGLRGVRHVKRRLSERTGREKSIRTSSLNLLANQVRYGGIGAYSALLENCHLAAMRTIAPRLLGEKLGEAFPRPPDRLPVWDEDRPLPLDGLREWGSRCHLGEFTGDEARWLAEALRGGEEGEWDDEVRWTALRMLGVFGDGWGEERLLLDRLLAAIRDGETERLKSPTECLRQIETALVLIRPYERLYQASQFLFDAVRAAATDDPEADLHALGSTPACLSACLGARSAASALLEAIEHAAEIHPQTAQDLRGALIESGVFVFAEAARGAPDAEALILLLDRHREVQRGKFDRGESKVPWIQHDRAKGSVRLTAQRHQLPRSDRHEGWEEFPWHPYRTFGARRFVRACGIR